MVNILIVEDDPNIAKSIEIATSIVGYCCKHCADGVTAVKEVLTGSYDIVLLDVMLPELNGFEVIERIRDSGTPVIFLTAMGDVTDKIQGLRMGAEDYIVKPFEAMELLARIEVVLRRFKKDSDILHFRDITVDVDKHMVIQNSVGVDLTPKEFDVLVFFMRNQNLAISRDRLLAAVWGYDFEGESRTVDIHIQQIRKKLDLKKYLVTIPKLGYRLDSEVDG